MDNYLYLFLALNFVVLPSEALWHQQQITEQLVSEAIVSQQILNYFRIFGLDRFSSNESLQLLMQLASNESELNDLFNKTKITPNCANSLRNLIKPGLNYVLNKNWTGLFTWFMSSPLFLYIESWGFPTNRLYFGNAAWLGAFDECQSISGSQYCVADMILFNDSIPLSGELGTCTPKECSAGDIFHLLSLTKSYLFAEFPSNGKFVTTYNVPPIVCTSSRVWTNGAVICMGLLCILALLNILGTLLDIIKDAFTPDYLLDEISFENNGTSYNRFGEASVNMQRGNHFIEIVMCFSILKNIPRALSVNMAKNAVHSINGIKVISMSWIVLGHCYYFLHYVSSDNLHVSLVNLFHTFSFQAISNAYMSADTFFLLSGFLVAYTSFKKLEEKGKINLLLFYLHRLMRVTPTYMLVIFIYSSLIPILIDGPVTFKFKEKIAMCQMYWWTNLLYINNFYPKTYEMCLEWSWYLSNDMQFYFISPMFIYLMHRFKRFGAWLTACFGILCCMIITICLTAFYNIPQMPSSQFLETFNEHKVNIFNDYIYSKPYTRFTPYLVGLLLGNILSKDMKIKHNWMKIICGWIIAFGIGLAVVYGPYTAIRHMNGMFNEVENIFYGALSKVSWAVAVSWVIYACHNNLGGLINRFLSWNVFLPISRLTFGVYLVHPIVLLLCYYSLDNPVHIENITMVFLFFGTWMISFATAFILAVGLDLPIINLEEKLRRKFLTLNKTRDIVFH